MSGSGTPTAVASARVEPVPAVVGQRTFRGPRALALLPGLLVGLAMIWGSSVEVAGRRTFTLLDDALISMTYARTFARTGELVWFPGADRVEGFTNPGYTLIMTVPHALGLDDSAVSLVMSFFGLATVLATGYLAGGIVQRFRPTVTAAVATTVTVTCSFPLLYWSVFGLEVGLIALLFVGVLVLTIRAAERGFPLGSLIGVALLSAAGVLVRPDFAVVAGLIALWAVVLPVTATAGGAATGTASSRLVRAVVLGAGVVGSFAVITAARWAYYAAPTPNTYDLKVGNSTLLMRATRTWNVDTEALWLVALGAAAIVLLWWRGPRERRPLLVLFGSLVLGQVAYTFYVGGDTFHPDRFLVPVTILVTVLAVAAILLLPRSGAWGWSSAVVGVLVLAVVLWRSVPEPWNLIAVVPPLGLAVGALIPRIRSRWVPAIPLVAICVSLIGLTAGNDVAGYRGWYQNGAALWPLDRLALERTFEYARLTDPDAVFGVFGAGAIPYWAQRPAVDLLGKSDRVIARQERRDRFIPGHDKWDYTHSIIGLRPDLVDADLLNPDSPVALAFPAFGSEREQMARLYLRMCLPNGDAIMVRKDTTLVDRTTLELCPVGQEPSPKAPGPAEGMLPATP